MRQNASGKRSWDVKLSEESIFASLVALIGNGIALLELSSGPATYAVVSLERTPSLAGLDCT
jgi:hypothetical protein